MAEDRIAAGFYKGRAVAGTEQFGFNPENGNEQIALDLDIPALGKRFTTFLFFTDKAAPYAIERLRACGWSGDDVTRLDGIDRNEIDVQVKYETWQGKERMKVDIATGGGRITLESLMDERQKRAFSARMKTLLSGSANTSARQQTPSVNASKPTRREGAFDPGPPPDDSEIPF